MYISVLLCCNYMENVTTAFQRERKRSIHYDNIHAGAIVTERNRAENAEKAVWGRIVVLGEQVFQLEVALSKLLS